MRSSRVIPVLLLSQSGLVKTTKFGAPVYIGDAINAVKIFNDKEADEILILDIEATKLGKEPNFGQIEEIASEAFMPLGYGGGITSVSQMEKLYLIQGSTLTLIYLMKLPRYLEVRVLSLVLMSKKIISVAIVYIQIQGQEKRK